MQYFIFVFYTGLHYLSSGVLAKYSLSIKPSILFLITWGLGMNRAFNCSVTCLQKQKQQRIRWTMSWNFRQFQQVRHSAGSRPWDNDRGGGGRGEGRSSRPLEKGGRSPKKFFRSFGPLPWTRHWDIKVDSGALVAYDGLDDKEND